MGILTYTLMTYALTVVISLAVVGLIVLINKTVSATEGKETTQDE